MAITWTWTYNESKATATYTNEANNTTITISNIYGVGETGKKSVDKYLSIDENTITVKADVLGAKDVSIKVAKTNSKGDAATTYTLALDGGVPTSGLITDAWTVAGTKATWTQTKAKYYGLVNGAIKYYAPTTFELANITGLNTSVAAAVTAGTAISNYITVNADSTPANIQLSAAALGTGKTTLTNTNKTADLAGATPTQYELSVPSGVLTSSETNKGKAVWTLSKGTATYKVCTAGQYYAFNDPKTIIEYKAPTYDKTTAATFTITGLNTTVTTNGTGTIPGITISISDKTVKVARSLFNGKDIAITGDGYKLEIDNDISAADINTTLGKTEWSLAKTTATFTQTLAKGYTLSADGKSIYYTAKDTDSRVLATVDGVNTELNTAAKLAEALTVNNETGVITVSAAALNEAKLTAKKGNYTLALATDEATEAVTVKSTTAPAWSIKGTTATYSTEDTAGYRVSLTNPKEITYSAKPTTTVIATITNVSTGLAGKTEAELDEYFDVNAAAKAITVDAGALGTATMKQTAKTGYTIAFDEEDDTIPQEAVEVSGGWLISKGTATFQKYTAGYYANSNGTIAYTADKKDKASITIKGLNANATAADLKDGLSKEVNAVTINSKDLLGTGTISITGGTIAIGTIDGVYTTKEAAEAAAKNAWNVSGTKATYNRTVPEYYVADSKNPTTKINYVKATPDKEAQITINGISKNTTAKDITIDDKFENVTLAANALMGLKVGSSVTITPSNDVPYKLVLGDDVTEATAAESPTFAYDGKKVKLTQGYTTDGYVCDGKSITAVTKTSGLPLVTITGLKDQSALGSGKDIKDKDYISVEGSVITVGKDALNSANVTMQVASGSYTFKLGEGTDEPGYTRSIAISGKDAAKNTGANISETVSGGYTLGSGDQTILYTKPITSPKVAATVSGLKEGSTVGEKGESKDVTYDKTTGVITVNANALQEDPKKKVSLAVKIANTGMNYSLALSGDVTKSATTGDNAPAFSYDTKDNVLLKQTPGEGFMISPDGKGIAYYNGKTEITLATISGLDKTIPEEKLGDYLTLGKDANGVPTITLKEGILSSTKITIKGTYGYVLGLDEEDVATEPKTIDNGWVINKTTAEYMTNSQSAYYVPAANKTSIEYKPSTGTGTSTITIEGLKSGLSVNANGKIDGLSTKGKVITLDNRVLGTSDIKLTKGNYTLALSTSEDKDKAVPTGDSEQTWAINKNTATLTAKTEEGYTLEEGSKSIKYTPASASTTLATISGFNSALTEETIGDYFTASDTELTVKAGALGRDDLKLTNNKGTCTELVLGSDVAKAGGFGESSAWILNGTTAEYYTNNCFDGYYTVESNKTVKYVPPAKDANSQTSTFSGAKITGLAKNFKIFDGDFDVSGEMVTVAKSVLSTLGNGKTLQISGTTTVNGKETDYYLAVPADVKSTPEDPTWAYNNNKLEIKQVQPAGYMLSDSNKTITYIKDDKTATLATITGIKTGLTDEELKNAISISATGVITITNSLINSENPANIALSTKGNYTLALAAGSKYGAELTKSAWSVKGITATYTQTYGKGYSLSADGKSLTYSSNEKNDVNAVKLNGILLTADELNAEKDAPVTIKDNVITLNDKALAGTTAVKIDGKNSKYTLAAKGVNTSGGEGKTSAWVIEYDKTAKTYTAKFTKAYSPYYSVVNENGVSSITYTPAAAVNSEATPTITINGIATNATLTTTGDNADIKVSGSEVILSKDALAKMTDKSKITISGTDPSTTEAYKLKLGTGVTEAGLTAKWTVTGKDSAAKTAVYTQTHTAGYTLADNAITYTPKDTTVTLLTLKNLSPNFTAGETDVTEVVKSGKGVNGLQLGGNHVVKLQGNDVVLSAGALGTARTTLTQGKNFDKTATEYSIQLDDTTKSTVETSWYVNGTVAKYIACDTNTWTTTADKKTELNTAVNYVASKPTEGATPQIILEGLKGVTALTEVTKISADTDIIRNTSGKTITVADKIIANSSKLALTYGDYKFALAEGSEVVKAATLGMKWKEAAGTSTTATLMQTRTKNKWYLSNNEKTITKATNTDAQIAQIKGLAKTTTAPTLTEDATIVAFETSQLSKKVTIDSGEGIEFTLGDRIKKDEGYTEYTGAAITGGANADIADVYGSGHTITGGKGNDQITIHADNTLVYASGDGDDLITGFTKGSTIKINGMAVADFSKTGNDISAKVSGDNIVVTLTKGATVGTMTLVKPEDVSISDLKIVDKSGNTITPTPTTATSDLIYSDNYATASELSDMVSGGSDTFSVGNIDTGNATNIAQQDTPIITGSDDK
ncbi:MAG: hypothetical protein SR2Q5_07200 [Quinella sp. 2Q5]|nr:hypothetical protein [Quinella sp. 2Q5]